jgi:hypothetical protein
MRECAVKVLVFAVVGSAVIAGAAEPPDPGPPSAARNELLREDFEGARSGFKGIRITEIGGYRGHTRTHAGGRTVKATVAPGKEQFTGDVPLRANLAIPEGTKQVRLTFSAALGGPMQPHARHWCDAFLVLARRGTKEKSKRIYSGRIYFTEKNETVFAASSAAVDPREGAWDTVEAVVLRVFLKHEKPGAGNPVAFEQTVYFDDIAVVAEPAAQQGQK